MIISIKKINNKFTSSGAIVKKKQLVYKLIFRLRGRHFAIHYTINMTSIIFDFEERKKFVDF